MNKSEIKKRYKAIDREHGSEGRNLYTCINRHQTLATHKDKGVTPMIIPCPICKTKAYSAMYEIKQTGSLSIGHIHAHIEWYRPILKQLLKENDELIEYVLDGALLFRRKPVGNIIL